MGSRCFIGGERWWEIKIKVMKIFTAADNNGMNIFVFGSNEAGIHGAGAAAEAVRVWGAIPGIGYGRQGMAFGIPTKDYDVHTLPLTAIQDYVSDFLDYARSVTPQLRFLVTKIGCGLAGYLEEDIKPMFAGAPENCELPDGWREA